MTEKPKIGRQYHHYREKKALTLIAIHGYHCCLCRPDGTLVSATVECLSPVPKGNQQEQCRKPRLRRSRSITKKWVVGRLYRWEGFIVKLELICGDEVWVQFSSGEYTTAPLENLRPVPPGFTVKRVPVDAGLAYLRQGLPGFGENETHDEWGDLKG